MRILLLLVVLLVGCATTPVIYNPSEIKIVYADKPMINNNKPVSGLAIWGKDRCIIILPRDDLRCYIHELVHCFKGPFHGQIPSREYCD